MTQVQKLVVTRQTTVELTTDGATQPMVDLEAVGRQMITGAAVEGAKEIEAGRAADEAEKQADESVVLEKPEDVRKYAEDVVNASLGADLPVEAFGDHPWQKIGDAETLPGLEASSSFVELPLTEDLVLNDFHDNLR